MKYTLLSCMLIITHVCISMDKDHNEDGVRRRSRTRSDQERRSHDVALMTLLRNNGDERRSLPEHRKAFNQHGSFVFFDTDEVTTTTGKNRRQSTSEPALPTHPTDTNQ